ncbi:MAG TPA: hypothetical protein VKW06_01130 [Candidatus Angelobacter sp.]|nr:hypothetical protein [Candidatus Angelobacter sp.]
MIILVVVFLAAAAPLFPGQAKSRREAMGEERASEVETLLSKLAPGSSVVWDPQLAIRVGSDQPIPIDMADFKVQPQADGSLWGVAALELGTAKKDYLAKLTKFQTVDSQSFATTLVVFRTNASGKTITDWKKFDLAPPGLSRIQVLLVQDWPAGKWPVVSAQYTSYFPNGNSLAALEWYSLFDADTASFRSRMPAGLVINSKDGSSAMEMFSVRRLDSGNIEIRGEFAKRAITYPCTDPCVVDGPTFLSKWVQ